MTDKERRTLRSNAMGMAVRTSKVGEDALAILARAQLFEEYLLGAVRVSSIPAQPARAVGRPSTP